MTNSYIQLEKSFPVEPDDRFEVDQEMSLKIEV